MTRNTDFSLNVSGTSVENGVTTVFIASRAPQNTTVFGATVFISGTGNNVNGAEPFSIEGHLNPAATQLTIATMTFGTNENVTGALAKQ